MKLTNKLALTIFLITSTISYSQQPTDCIDAITVCGNSNVSLDVNGIGTQELSGSNTCSSQENNSIWLKVTTVNDGTLAFTLTPESSDISEDYDFFIFGPNVSCGNIGQAIRCSTTNPQAANQNNNLTGLSTNQTDNSEGPGSLGNSFVSAINASAGDTYYIVIDRPIGNSPFSLDWTGTAQFAEPPSNDAVNTSSINLENCDVISPYDDGITSFDLELNTPVITGNQNNIAITYHTSESDANIDTNPLSSPYTNLSNPQTIYAKVTNTTTDCYTIVPFELAIKSGPDVNDPSDYQLCDDTSDGDEFNGQTTFFLPNKNDEIGGANTSNYTFTYHLSLVDATNNTNALNDNFYNTTANLQTIYVRVENPSDPGCTTIKPLNLVVNEVITTYDSSIYQCDEDGFFDGLTIFNLSEANEDLTGGLPDMHVDFYLNTTDASNQTNLLNDDNYNNISNPETITAVITNTITGCFDTAQLTLEVSTTSISNYNAPDACDEVNSEDGLNTFNLDNFSTEILNGLPPNLGINYYENYNDALLEQNPLPTNYNNTTPYNQTIYARVEDDNACYGISEVYLTINQLPQLEDDEAILYCLNNFPENVQLSGGIINDTPNNYYYSWSTGETTINIDVNTVGSYTVTASNVLGCSKSRIITVQPSNIATIEDLIISDGTLNNQITIIASGEGDYMYQLTNSLGETSGYQTSNTFSNIAPGFYTANIMDIKNNCGTIDQMFSVIGFPLFFTPNDDGKNDYWQVYGVSPQFQANSIIQIFDRYGKLLKEFTPNSQGWDGTFNGQPLPTNDYWFTVKLQDGRIYRNHFTLKR
ncbi:T9SS type B sorting domain-containing protein [uncultured Olleya sp.]|uniref:T9SS type B sorting domain-containing protein n=1 Tax=uncultured Olleya sp. TaxID=757243 RepID=UPI00259659F0|nr:T9SS type B sorting domain-containing protein [uncultured Olleya sp.]